MLEIGLKGEAAEVVSENNTAKAVKSGELDVYATPAMIALMEQAAYKSVAAELEDGQGTVGTSISVRHLAATPIGMKVTAKSKLAEIDGRRLVFVLEVWDEAVKIGEGIHERVLIQNEAFLTKANAKLER
ncbi:MAG: thioesterase family protein [Clostridiales bacterium]|nr:thioesterase family protein [Clostridiales bacterium]